MEDILTGRRPVPPVPLAKPTMNSRTLDSSASSSGLRPVSAFEDEITKHLETASKHSTSSSNIQVSFFTLVKPTINQLLIPLYNCCKMQTTIDS